MPLAAPCADDPTLGRDGAEHFPAVLSRAERAALGNAFRLAPGRPGARLGPGRNLRPLLGAADAIAASFLGPASRAVRAVLLDKNPGRNWALGWHQDRTVALRARRPVEGFGAWTVKAGIVHVEPPFALLERMLTVRIHLDPAGPGNAPLLIVRGSHRLGRIAEADADAIAERDGAFACLAEAGDIWAFAPTILHASERSTTLAGRRVLQLSYSADDLPGGLEWLGV